MNTHSSDQPAPPFTATDFGEKFSGHSGICELMEDLGAATAQGGDIVMMGGGAPAHIPAVEAVWRRRMEEIMAAPGQLEAMLGDYDTPRGNIAFLEILADYFNRTLGWDITAENITLTGSSQSSSFLLFNLLGGMTRGKRRRILFPIVPEYIGYADQGIDHGLFTAWKPRIEHTGPHRFKYRIEFGDIAGDIAAICVSRPTNPTTNVITDDEAFHLASLAEKRGIFLIIDNAYGRPFPGVVFRPVTLPRGPHVIHTFSLSKLGLPGTRTGIIVADRAIIRRLGVMNANLALSNCTVGQAILKPLLAGDTITRLCENEVRAFYRARCDETLALITEQFDDALDWHVHECEGAFFIWLWLRGLPIDDRELYRRLKSRGMLVVPGSYFFAGLDEEWPHKRECIRLNYATDPGRVRRGIGILAEEIRRAYSEP
jgi:valine--pyruvate aminotransferase